MALKIAKVVVVGIETEEEVVVALERTFAEEEESDTAAVAAWRGILVVVVLVVASFVAQLVLLALLWTMQSADHEAKVEHSMVVSVAVGSTRQDRCCCCCCRFRLRCSSTTWSTGTYSTVS